MVFARFELAGLGRTLDRTHWPRMAPELFIDMARCLERAGFDYLLIEDSSYVGESFGGSTEL